MYYHSRPLKHVVYGKVYPYTEPDDWLLPAYRWLGHYCGYCPQLWLARGDIAMTGDRTKDGGLVPHKKPDAILFGFDIIRGFPVDFSFWGWDLLNEVIHRPTASRTEINRALAEHFDDYIAFLKTEEPQAYAAGEYPMETAWERCRDIDVYLQKHVFVERDQVVVPALNLKAAKKVFCRNERQKKALRRMGFIEDRIEIRNMPR